MTEIAIYAEGGGDSAQQKAELRQGFDGLLSRQKTEAQKKRLGWKVVPCGARQDTYEAFMNALRIKPDAINVLLVDAEGQIASVISSAEQDAKVRIDHLARHDRWDFSGVRPECVHLMVQCMEAWIVADGSALESYYGQGFAPKALPRRQNLEEEPKELVYEKLTKATRTTQKGEYAKIKHASQLLQRIDREKVAMHCPRFALLTRWLKEAIDSV